MRGVVFVGDGRVEVKEFPLPRPKGTQVLVKMKAAGLCGSDMHSYRNPREYWADIHIIRGHEPGGIVDQVGEAVTMVQVGDPVSVYHAPSCGHCEACSRGEFFRCTTIGPGYRLASHKVHGCDADYLLLDQNVCFALPDQLDMEDAATIACAGGTAYHALRRADIRAGQYVLVSGLGPVGLCAVLLADAMGGIVIGADPVAYRRELALQHGARHVIDPTTSDVPAAVHRITGDGAEVAIETSGNDQARVDALESASLAGSRVVYVGIGGTAKNITLSQALRLRWLTGSSMFTSSDYYELTRLMVRTGIHLSDLVTHRFPLAQAQEAFDLFATRQTGKVMFVWD